MSRKARKSASKANLLLLAQEESTATNPQTSFEEYINKFTTSMSSSTPKI